MEADKARHDTTNQNNTGAAESMSDLLLTSCKAIKEHITMIEPVKRIAPLSLKKHLSSTMFGMFLFIFSRDFFILYFPIKLIVFVSSVISETLALVSLLVIYHFSMRFTRDFLRLAPVCREGGVPRVLLRFLQHKKLLKELEKNLKT